MLHSKIACNIIADQKRTASKLTSWSCLSLVKSKNILHEGRVTGFPFHSHISSKEEMLTGRIFFCLSKIFGKPSSLIARSETQVI